jgi:hypothetical protein
VVTRQSPVGRRVSGGGRVPRDGWCGLLAMRPPNLVELPLVLWIGQNFIIVAVVNKLFHMLLSYFVVLYYAASTDS